MDESLEIKNMERKIVELLVVKELNKLSKEAAMAAIDCVGTGKKYEVLDCEKWARKIISIVKEHSL